MPPPVALGAVSFRHLSNLHKHEPSIRGATVAIGVVLVHGRWQPTSTLPHQAQLQYWTEHSLVDIVQARTFSATVVVDVDGDHDDVEMFFENYGASLPSQLPALMVVHVVQTAERSQKSTFVRHVHPNQLVYPAGQRNTSITTADRIVLRSLTDHVDGLLEQYSEELTVAPSTALRLWIAGDRSTVGKSSVCLGLLMSLLEDSSFQPESIAYMKPATQSEASSLIGDVCTRRGIANVPIGPLVYYRGMTRAFLAGSTSAASQLLESCAAGVHRMARGKRLVLLDGVGFPAVGSICGTSNAAVAAACGAHGIVIVGGPGVGAAVDAYNLNSTYFRHHAPNVPVLGAIFNKLPTAPGSYYSLAACREQVTSYFQQYRPKEQAFGFVPLWPGGLTLDTMGAFVQSFAKHVDVAAILKALALAATDNGDAEMEDTPASSAPEATPKRRKLTHEMRSRQEIEQAAISAGAAPSA